MGLTELVAFLDDYLGTDNISDSPHAFNGLQVESRRPSIERVAFAVDASQATIDLAVQDGADMLVVHHGLFWDGSEPITGRRFRRVRSLIEADIALYSSHLPLDVHPVVGNNVVLAKELGIALCGTFSDSRGIDLGVWGTLELRREALAARLDQVLGCRVRMIAGGPEQVRKVGVITGGAGSRVESARLAGLDAFITGEGAHHNYFDASEGGINLYLGGHYATEVWGLRALAEYLQRERSLETIFLDQPTGL